MSEPTAGCQRVLHLGKFYPPAPGGIETHLRTLARAQAALGADVRVLCVNHAGADGRDRNGRPFAPTPTVRGHDGPVRLTRVGRRASVARLDLCPGLVRELRAAFSERPDVVHLHAPNPAMTLALAAAPPPAPLVVTHHSDVHRQRLLRVLFGPVERRVYDRATRVFATSPLYAAGSRLLARYAAKTADLPLGLDLAPYQNPGPEAKAFARRLRAEHRWPLWLFVGRLVYYKGLHTALEALTGVPGTLGVVGTGPLERRLRRHAKTLGVADRVAWLGAATADELAGAYRAAAALWFPSNARSEGFGLVQVEAMAAGVPVLNTAVPHSGVAWVCRDGREGLTVPVGDARALARAANRLLDDPVLRERLGQNGRERAAAEFGHETMARRSLDAYRAALGVIPEDRQVSAGVA